MIYFLSPKETVQQNQVYLDFLEKWNSKFVLEGMFLQSASPDASKKSTRLSKCHDRVEFYWVINGPNWMKERWFDKTKNKWVLSSHRAVKRGAFHCQVRGCPLCEERRAIKRWYSVKGMQEAIQKAYPAVRFLKVTLAIEDCPPEKLGLSWERLTSSWLKLNKILKLDFGVVGNARVVEVCRAKIEGVVTPFLFRVHLHVILALPDQSSADTLTTDALRSEWSKIVGANSHVDVQGTTKPADFIKYASKGIVGLTAYFEEGPGHEGWGGVNEAHQIITILSEIESRHAFDTSGVFRSLKTQEKKYGSYDNLSTNKPAATWNAAEGCLV